MMQSADLGDGLHSSPPRRLDDARERSVVIQSAAACLLAESPQATRCVQGSDDFVASIAAPTATGWNDSCRAGFAPAEDARLGTAHSILTLRELTQASVAYAWKQYLGLKLNGDKEPDKFLSTLATRSYQAVRNGRAVNGQERSRSVHNRMTQTQRGFVVGSLADHDTSSEDTDVLRAMQDDEASPADLAACLVDTKAWLSHLDDRKRNMALDMIAGETTTDLAAKYEASQGHISQIRCQLVEDHGRFMGGRPRARCWSLTIRADKGAGLLHQTGTSVAQYQSPYQGRVFGRGVVLIHGSMNHG
jgi:hypothetical protein